MALYEASLDHHAFQRAPEVGPPADMMDDDLPSNLDYLDDSFSAAAGLRELRDDDLDDFDTNDSTSGRSTPTPSMQTTGVISVVGGETIKMLRPLRIVERYFDRLPPQVAGTDTEFVAFLIFPAGITTETHLDLDQRLCALDCENVMQFCFSMMDMTGSELERPSRKKSRGCDAGY